MMNSCLSRVALVKWGRFCWGRVRCRGHHLSVSRRAVTGRKEILSAGIPSEVYHSGCATHGRCATLKLLNHSTNTRWLHTDTVLRGKVIAFNLPDVGEAIHSVEVKEWLVKEGDRVVEGDELCEVQSDKSSVTLYIPFDGIIKQLMHEEGAVAAKGEPLVMIEVDSTTEEEDSHTTPTSAPPPTTDSTTVADVQTTPAVRKLASEHSVDLRKVTGTGKNGLVLKEDVLQYIESSPKVSDVLAEVEVGDTTQKYGKVLATPAVRRMASEEGVNLSEVQGTGEDGRVLKEDLQRHVEAERTQPPSIPTTVTGEDKTEEIRGIKSVMVRTMTASGQIPQFVYCDEVNMSQMVLIHSAIKEQFFKERGFKISYMPILIKALSMALMEYPILNSTVNSECTSITYKASHNIGIAVDTPSGLVVPNVKQVQNKSIIEIALELNRLHELGLKGKIPPSDIAGGTFSLSNIGAIGGTYSSPMILPPEVAIGAFGKIHVLPRFNSSGEVYAAHVMEVSWSADHRVIEGATVARFSNKWKVLLEDPSSMILNFH